MIVMQLSMIHTPAPPFPPLLPPPDDPPLFLDPPPLALPPLGISQLITINNRDHAS